MYRAIIVEPRIHNALPFVLQNFDENLSDEWSILVFHGTENNIFIIAIKKYHSHFISLKT